MLTKKQLKLLEFLKKYKEKEGIFPSYEEMKAGLGLKSKSGIFGLITELEERGFLKRLPGRARALEVIKFPLEMNAPSHAFVAREDERTSAPHRRQKKEEDPSIVKIPFFGEIPSSVAVSAFLQPREYLSVPVALIRGFEPTKQESYLSVQVKGEFLQKKGILDGDILILEESSLFKADEVLLGIIDHQEVCLCYSSTLATNMVPKAHVVGLLRKY